MDDKKLNNLSEDWQMDTQSIRERGKYLLDNALWTDCKFLVGTEESNKVSSLSLRFIYLFIHLFFSMIKRERHFTHFIESVEN